jgi:hypothetical protein
VPTERFLSEYTELRVLYHKRELKRAAATQQVLS